MTNCLKKNDNNCFTIILLVNLLSIFFLPSKSEEDVGDIEKDIENFELELFFKIAYSKPNENIVISPLALATLLLLIRVSSAPKVASEIVEALHLSGQSEPVLTQKFNEILEKFKNHNLFSMSNTISVISKNSLIEVMSMDGKGTIEEWRRHSICLKIAELSNPNAPTLVQLSTGIRFNNRLLKYDIKYRYKDKFYPNSHETIVLRMMQMLGKLKYAKIPELQATAVELPYYDGLTSLIVLLPDNKEGIKNLEYDLYNFNIREISSYLREEIIQLKMPMFIANVNQSLVDNFKFMGLSSMFIRLCDIPFIIKVADVNYNAKFIHNGKSARDDPLYKINVTALTDYPFFTADHPFVYIVKSSTNLIYLIGRFVR
ncbi:serine protease inhibitor 42Dd-like [Cochliomyia hominivorax]